MNARLSNPELFRKLQMIIAEITGNEPEDVSFDMEMSELRLSPLDQAQLIASISHQLSVPLSRNQFNELETIEDLVLYLDEELE